MELGICRSNEGARLLPVGNTLPTIVFAPHAGGSASAFAPLRVRLLKCAKFVGVEYPGRRQRCLSESPQSVEDMAGCLIGAIEARALRNVTLWGYSLGALVVLRAAQRLAQGGDSPVRHLVVAACRAPHRFSARQISRLEDDAAFLDAVRQLGGLPVETSGNARWLAQAMPALRADFSVCGRYRHHDGTPLSVPLTVLSGSNDALSPSEEMSEWRGYTTAAFSHRVFSGGHFFIHDHVDEVATILACAAGAASYVDAA